MARCIEAENVLCMDPSFSPSVKILSAFASLMPLIVHNVFFGVNATASTVCNPASDSFLVSDDEIPAS